MRRIPALLLVATLLCVLMTQLVPPPFPGSAAAQQASPVSAITTDRLNLRSGPGTSYAVVLVMPLEARVELSGKESNGFRSVRYNNREGWAFGAYLSIDEPAPSPNATATTTDRLNLRSGPGTSFGIVTVLPNKAIVTLTGQAENNFRSVTWGAFNGWVSSLYLGFDTPTEPPVVVPDRDAVTTENVNFRTGPGLSYSVIRVVSAGTRITVTDRVTNRYRSVSVDGRAGWIHDDYIAADRSVPEPASRATTTDRLNLRSAPNTGSSILLVIPNGAAVSLTGQASNGFRSVRYGSTDGWAFDAYLTIEASPPALVLPFDVTNMIVAPRRGSSDEAIAYARAAGAQRMDQVILYITEVYRRAPEVGFDPAILVAQSALETNYWRSSWWTIRLNPAGIGVTGNPNQNAESPVFASGTIAARAQLAHMHAEVYGNRQPLPPVLQGVDPTHQRVFEAGWAGTIVTIADLSGTWAVDPAYADKIVIRARIIFDE